MAQPVFVPIKAVLQTFKQPVEPRDACVESLYFAAQGGQLVVQTRHVCRVGGEALVLLKRAEPAGCGCLAPGIALHMQGVVFGAHKGPPQAPQRPGKQPLNQQHKQACPVGRKNVHGYSILQNHWLVAASRA